MRYTSSAHFCQSCSTWQHATYSTVHQLLDGNHQPPVTRLSVKELVILVTHASQLHLTRLHPVTGSNLTAFGISILSGSMRVYVRVLVCEKEHRGSFLCPFFNPLQRGFDYLPVHKLLLEPLVEHLQASTSLKMNIANAYSKSKKMVP